MNTFALFCGEFGVSLDQIPRNEDTESSKRRKKCMRSIYNTHTKAITHTPIHTKETTITKHLIYSNNNKNKHRMANTRTH